MERVSFHLNAEKEKAFGYAQGVRYGDYLHISGSLSVDQAFNPLNPGNMEGQLRQVYGTILQTLQAFDTGFPNVLSERVFVTDMDAFLAANAVRLEMYQGYDLPATTVVEVQRLAFIECMVEVELLAVV